MIIKIASGNVTINKKSAYGKWLLGWAAGGGWTGAVTLGSQWSRAKMLKSHVQQGVSWFALGLLMARMVEDCNK